MTQRNPSLPPIWPAIHGRIMPPLNATAKRMPNTVPECDLNRAPAIPSTAGYMPAIAPPVRTIAIVATAELPAIEESTDPAQAQIEQNSRTRYGSALRAPRLRKPRVRIPDAQ